MDIIVLPAQAGVAMQTWEYSHLRKLRKCLCKDVWAVRPSSSVRMSDQRTLFQRG